MAIFILIKYAGFMGGYRVVKLQKSEPSHYTLYYPGRFTKAGTTAKY
jgi:hypothetical protein